MKKLNLYTLLSVMICGLLWACTDNDILPSGSSGHIFGRVELRLFIPAMTEVHTRSTEEAAISSLYVVAYEADGTCCVSRPIDIENELVEEGNGNSYKLTLNFKEEVSDVHLIANANSTTSLSTNGTKERLDEIFETTIGETLLLWGHVDMNGIKSGTANVSLLRNVAKASIEVDEAIKDNFTIIDWGFTNTASAGSVAPKGYSTSPTEVNNQTDETFGKRIGMSTPEGSSAPAEYYFYETPSGKDTRILIKAKNKKQEVRFYTALFLNSSGDQFTLWRNHCYTLKVVSVGNGYTSEDDALKAPAGNIQVDIKDHNYLISDMVSNGAYDLGVCDTVRVTAEAGAYGEDFKTHPIEQIAYFVTLWGTDEDITFEPEVKQQQDGSSDWLTDVGINEEGKYDVPLANDNSKGKGYVVKFKCAKNPKEEIRYGHLLVTFGELSRTIVIEQAAANLKKDRNTYIMGLPDDNNGNGKEYIHWLLYDVKGVSTADMGGKTRNNGLHLGIGDETSEYRHNYTYKIEKKEGDTNPNISGSRSEYQMSTMFVNGQTLDCYEIKAKDPADPTVWIEQFEVTNNESITITYDLYHTGIFQKGATSVERKKDGAVMSGQTIDVQPNNTDLQRTDWYYYEVMTESQTGVSMFDRNLGATGVDDAGGYYLLKQGSKEESDIVSVCPKGYILPPLSFWETMMEKDKHQLVTRYQADGSSYQSWEVNANTNDDVQASSIRFPRGGYCIGDERYNAAIGYYWSTTPVSGNQGFDVNSFEYGYWYRIARLSTDGENVFSVRYADGSNGTANSPYRYMSARCVRDDAQLTAEKNRLTIIDKRKNIQDLYIYISTDKGEYYNRFSGEMIRSSSNGTEKTIYYDMIDPEVIMESIGKSLYIRFRQGEDKKEEGWIGLPLLIGENRKFIVTDNLFYPEDYDYNNGHGGNVGDMDMDGDNWGPKTDQGNSMDMEGDTWGNKE